jgi:hypothetical protein
MFIYDVQVSIWLMLTRITVVLKIAMKGTRFEVVSLIQQTVMRELKAIQEKALSWAFDLLYE